MHSKLNPNKNFCTILYCVPYYTKITSKCKFKIQNIKISLPTHSSGASASYSTDPRQCSLLVQCCLSIKSRLLATVSNKRTTWGMEKNNRYRNYFHKCTCQIGRQKLAPRVTRACEYKLPPPLWVP